MHLSHPLPGSCGPAWESHSPGDGKGTTREQKEIGKVSGRLDSSCSFFYWPRKVTWPNTKAGGGKIRSLFYMVNDANSGRGQNRGNSCSLPHSPSLTPEFFQAMWTPPSMRASATAPQWALSPPAPCLSAPCCAGSLVGLPESQVV